MQRRTRDERCVRREMTELAQRGFAEVVYRKMSGLSKKVDTPAGVNVRWPKAEGALHPVPSAVPRDRGDSAEIKCSATLSVNLSRTSERLAQGGRHVLQRLPVEKTVPEEDLYR